MTITFKPYNTGVRCLTFTRFHGLSQDLVSITHSPGYRDSAHNLEVMDLFLSGKFTVFCLESSLNIGNSPPSSIDLLG